MTISIRNGKIDKNKERKLLIAAIVSTQFLKQTSSFLTPDIFQIPYAKRIFKLAKNYFLKYEEAPNVNITDLFEAEKSVMTNEDIELTETFLNSISNQYVVEEKDNFNSQYAIDQARQYAKEQGLKKKISEVNGLLEMGKIDEAESAFVSYKRKAQETSKWVNPLDLSYVKSVFENKKNNALFSFPGALGELCRPFERSRMYAVAAPLKRGKSFLMGEIRTLALLNRLTVFEVNLEMPGASVSNRFYKRITATADNAGNSLYPVIDCLHNQLGKCNKPERKNKIALASHQDYLPKFEDAKKDYKVCSVCRGTPDFQYTTWFEEIYREELTPSAVEKKVISFSQMWSQDNWRLIAYPKFSATVDDLIRDIEFLEDSEDKVPDVIIVDYPALLRSRLKNEETRIQIAEIWKLLGGIAANKNCCVIGAAQINKEGSKKAKSSVFDIAETITIAQDCDGVFSLNQSEEQKKRGILSISVGALRDGAFNELDSVEILTDFNAGQVILDSYKTNG